MPRFGDINSRGRIYCYGAWRTREGLEKIRERSRNRSKKLTEAGINQMYRMFLYIAEDDFRERELQRKRIKHQKYKKKYNKARVERNRKSIFGPFAELAKLRYELKKELSYGKKKEQRSVSN